MERLQKIRLSILVLGTLMGALDSTIVILAFPVIAEELILIFSPPCGSSSSIF
ncbi:MAG: hypothetical protein RQM90_01285 [Methanoculleus sp.]